NLVVGDYFRVTGNDLLISTTTRACEVITWARSKTLLLGLIRDAYARHNHGKTKTVLRAVITRWTSHYSSFNRLLELQKALHLVILEDELKPAQDKLIVIGDAAAKVRANAMISILRAPDFWLNL
ncbi:hypothetical protein FA15DRAFT_553889, partial [Coprinopsis marcescibilis]